MFARFQISIEIVEKVLENRYLLLEDSSVSSEIEVTNMLMKLFSPVNGIISGDALKKDFFPTETKRKFKVFICHSHRDVDTVKKFANFLKDHFLIDCFVDSMAWKNIDTLQRGLDAELMKNGKICYSDVLRSSAHVHAMLSLALYEMIDNCECCIFVGSENSLCLNLKQIQTETLSPWIYQEIFYMNHTKLNMPSWLDDSTQYVANESYAPIRTYSDISHGIDLSEFRQLGLSDFSVLKRGDEFLRYIYWQHNFTRLK